MNSAYLSAFAALAGSLIGGLTSIVATWLTSTFSPEHSVPRRT